MIGRTVNWLSNFIVSTASWSFRWTFRILFFATPRILRWSLSLVRFLLLWMLLTVTSTARGPSRSTHEIASVWLERMMEAGFPRVLETRLFFLLKVSAGFMIILGWLLMLSLSIFAWWIAIDPSW